MKARDEEAKMDEIKINIDDEFVNLIPPISTDEIRELEKSILKEGCRDALITWDGMILDGHNRYRICLKHDIKFDTKDITWIKTREEAKLWIISNQLARRNLTPDQMSYLRGVRQNIEVGEHGGDRKSRYQNDTMKGRTREKLAKEYKVSQATIARDAKFALAVDKLPPEDKGDIKSPLSFWCYSRDS